MELRNIGKTIKRMHNGDGYSLVVSFLNTFILNARTEFIQNPAAAIGSNFIEGIIKRNGKSAVSFFIFRQTKAEIEN
jgi:hypothetical protein